MTGHNTLFVVEGHDDEKFLKRMLRVCNISCDNNEYVYESSIHVLISSLFTDDMLDEDLDVLMSLKEREKDDNKKEILSKGFENIYFVFDLDPQDNNADYEKISKLLDFLDDPTDNGKLYINYPMLESYRHLTSLHDQKFKGRKVSLSVLNRGLYKSIVDRECHKGLKQNANYDEKCFITITKMHMMKMNYILNGEYELMSEDEFLNSTGSDVFNEQHRLMENDGEVYVLNTSVFIVADYKPSLFFKH